MGFRSRQLITTGNKSIAMLLPLSAVLGSHRDIDTVMMGMKHTYVIQRNSPNNINYIHRTGAAAAGKFKIEHLSVWMPKLRPSLSVQTELEALLLSGEQRSLYFEQSVSIELSSGTRRQAPSGESLELPESSYPGTSSSPLPTSLGTEVRCRTIKSLIMLTWPGWPCWSTADNTRKERSLRNLPQPLEITRGRTCYAWKPSRNIPTRIRGVKCHSKTLQTSTRSYTSTCPTTETS